jgi:transposase
MHSIEFSDNDLKTIRFERFHHPDPRVARRMEILSLKAAGFRQRDISRAAGVSRSTIGRLLNIYREAGLSGVREFHEQGPTSPLSEHAGSPSEEFRLRPPSSTAEAAKRIEQLTGRLFRICNTTYINSHSVCELLKQIAQAGLQSPVTLVLDNARYQRCRLVEELAAELRIELLFLPSYSPNLNVIERLWKFVKKEVLNSRHLGNFNSFQIAIESCLDSLSGSRRSAITHLLTLRFQRFVQVVLLADTIAR